MFPNIANARKTHGSQKTTEVSDRAANAAQINAQTLRRELGNRYANCTLDGFGLSSEPADRQKQERVVSELRAYRSTLKERIAEGAGLFLFGPAGCGKDHLLSALMLETVLAGYSVQWFNGMDVYGAFRDRMDSETSEKQMIRDMAKPDVLALSDPIPPKGDVTDFQRSQLFRVIDRRYRDCKPTWITANVSSREEADQRFGVQLVDRLTDGALCLPCNWPSYRMSRRWRSGE